ncbi:MAG: hypothetical protein LBJ73_03095 [Rickettsiales bacterium]|jgi:hypothetical protein|nr:hypothetical protein [Rickettsiales bacterium]
MKKLMMGALVAAMFVSGAYAYDQADKDKCLANPYRVVWLESKGACIPINPCKKIKFSAYCDKKTFASINDIDVFLAQNLVSLWRGNGNDYLIGRVESNYIHHTHFQNNYINDYIVAKFGGLTTTTFSSAPNYLKGICAAFNVKESKNPEYNYDGYMSIECPINPSECSRISEATFWLGNVKATTTDEYTSCKISFSNERECGPFKDCKK